VASWKVTTSKLPEGALKWRARSYDGTDYSTAWTAWQPFTVDTTLPLKPTTLTSSQYTANVWNYTPTTGTFTWNASTSTDVETYRWGLDDPTPDQDGIGKSATINPMTGGWHTLYVRAVDRAGNLSDAKTFSFGAKPAVTSPHDGTTSAGTVTLTAMAKYNQASDYVTYEYRRTGSDPWTALPTADVTVQSTGLAITSWPYAFTATSPNSTPPALVWNLAHTLSDVDGPAQLQVCFGNPASS
jgi:hypothetical protein